jgi:CBS domain-containing protein
MTVANLLDKKGREVVSIHQDAIVYEAMQLLIEKNIGSLLVMDDKGEVMGILCERDILRSAFKAQANCKGLGVAQIMTPREKLVVAGEQDALESLMDAMTEKHIRHIPIVSKEGKPTGLISIGDLVKAQLSDKDYEIRYLKDYISHGYPG